MSDIVNPTPSAYIPIAPTLEHVEARQAAIDAERNAYIETLAADDRERFLAMEKAVKVLTEAKVPFFLWAKPNPAQLDSRAIWQYQKTTYLDPFGEVGNKEHNGFAWGAMWVILQFFATNGGYVIPVYSQDQGLVGIANPPKPIDNQSI